MSEPRTPGERLPARSLDPAAVDRVVALLTQHFAEDRISSDELEDRLERAYHAVTPAQLDAVVADLPANVAPASVPSAVAQRVVALLSAQEQRVTGVVPRQLELRARMGYVEMDLSRATFEPGLTEIDVRAVMGYVQIRLPAGVRVECLGRAVMGFFSVKGAREPAGAEAPCVVRVTGRAMMGFAEIFVGRRGAPGTSLSLPPDERR